MKRTIGNFLLQGNKDFPVDCELFEAMQANISLTAIIGNLAGDKTILAGCEAVGSNRNPGYVFLRTQDFPEGEVLYFEGGAVASGIYVKLENIAVTANGYNYPKAYTVRSLAPGVGSENYLWPDFKTVKSPAELEKEIQVLSDGLKQVALPPLGIPDIWAGIDIPSGYILCDGQQLKMTDYPELYAALGTQYNTALDYRGSAYVTTAGYFRVPDLRGRFVVGANANDDDYKKYGNAAGEKTHVLTGDESPEHVHTFKDYYYVEHADYAGLGIDGTDFGGSNLLGGGKSDRDNSTLFYKIHDTEKAGKGQAHENRPPYYTLAYIMRTK